MLAAILVGGVLGAYVLTHLDAEVARPFVLAYLGLLSIYLVWKGMRGPPTGTKPRYVAPLGLAGGFLDAAGGGGWGPIVISNLLVQGATPRQVIGTVVVAEFFLTVTISATFIVTMGWAAFTTATVGLLIGGILAAPLGAMVAKRVPARALLVLVGILLAAISMFAIWRTLAG